MSTIADASRPCAPSAAAPPGPPRGNGSRLNSAAPVRAFIPETLRLADHLPRMWHDHGAYFVHGLVRRRHTEKHRNPDGYYPVYSKAVRDYMPSHSSSAIMNSLLGSVVERDDSYRAGDRTCPGYSKGYRLTKGYRDAAHRVVELTDPGLVGRVRAHRARERDAVTDPVDRHIRNTVENVEVTADWPTPSLSLAMMANRDPFFTPCKYGRLHHHLTSLARNLRRFVRIDGQKLWTVDIKNSQPFILGMIAKGWADRATAKEFEAYKWERWTTWVNNRAHSQRQRDGGGRWPAVRRPGALPPTATTPTVPPHCPTARHHAKGHPPTPPPDVTLMLRSTCQSVGVWTDVDDYVNACRFGTLYELLLDEVQRNRRWVHGDSREHVKRRFMGAIYGEACDMETIVGTAIKTLYPTIFGLAHGLNELRHGWLPCEMQRVESFIVIRRAGARILREFPGVPFLTVHDSFVGLEQHVVAFGEILKDEFHRAFGFAPAVAMKPFTD